MTSDNDEHTIGSPGESTREMPPEHTVIVDAPRELGCYRLTKLLGRGGMGEVWQAFDMHLERDVAIKLMRKELLANEDATRRFAREARAVARLNHPNIVQVYAFGDEQGVAYFVMELVDGETVAQCLKRKGQIPMDDALHIMLQAIEGLSYANARGIIHRDIKPSNLMITEDTRVKIADFGLAKMVEHDTQMTVAGTAMGSPNYMSPEQARGEEADHRSDIYALGVSLYQMLCGQLPFTASSPVSVLLKQIQDPLPEPECLKPMGGGILLNVLKKMTAKAPADRYQSYGELATDLAALQPNLRFRGAHLPTGSMPAATPTYTPSLGEQSVPALGAGLASTSAPVSSPPPPPPPPAASAQATPLTPGTGVISSKDADVSPSTSPVVAPASGRKWMYVFAALVAIGLAGVTAWVVLAMLPEKAVDGTDIAAVPAQRDQDNDLPSVPSTEANSTPATTPSPSPAAVVPTGSPVQQTTVITSPAPTGMQPVDVTAVITPRPTPLPGVPTTITPTPSLAQLAPSSGQLVLGKSEDSAGAQVSIYNSQGTPIGALPAGTQVASIRPARLAGEQWYVIRHNNSEAFVKQSDARATGAAAVPTKGAATPAPQVYVLGMPGDTSGQPVPTYRDNRGRLEHKKFPKGTEVTLVERGVTMSRVKAPDEQIVFIYTKMASPKP